MTFFMKQTVNYSYILYILYIFKSVILMLYVNMEHISIQNNSFNDVYCIHKGPCHLCD